MENNEMNVFYFSSDLFASVMATSMLSLLENNKGFCEIVFYIVDDGITKEKKQLLERMVANYRIGKKKRLIFYLPAPAPKSVLKYSFKSRYQIGHSYFRMCIGALLPQSVERVLCLDCDTLVCADLTDLWNINMGDNILAGVSDCMNVSKYKEQFWMNVDNIYCNAGVFLVNLKKWRDENIEKKIVERIFKQNGNVFFFEQTLMNWACAGKILNLEPAYNVYTLFWAFEYNNLIRWRKPISFFTEEEVDDAKKNPKIIHFTRNFYMLSRPWIAGCDHPMTQRYQKFKKKTPWPDLDVDQRTKKQKKFYILWHTLPQAMLVTWANIVYNEIRPKMWWKNE